MREIKFRAWDRIENRMIDCDRLVFRSKPEVAIGLTSYTLNSFFREMSDRYTFSRFIGELPTGDEVYEGDIVEVVYDGERIRKEIKFEMEKGGSWGYGYHSQMEHVVGNIYENPELLTSQ